MITWITKKNDCIDRIRQTHDDVSLGPEWEKVPNNFGGNHGDKLDWFDSAMRRIPDTTLIEMERRKDNRGRWFNKNTMEQRIIYGLDEEIDSSWTKEQPLTDEPYQKWDETSGSWVIDIIVKETAKKEQDIAEKRAAIQDAEQRIQRSLIAREAGIATEDDELYFSQINTEILSLREELRQLIAA
jgi:hypothetical protein